jgi:cell division protein FtsW
MAVRAPARESTDTSDAHGASLLIGVIVMLNLIGLVMVLSASSVESLRANGSSWLYFERQAAYVVVGAALFVLGWKLDYTKLRRIAGPWLIGSIGLLVLVLVPGLGIAVNGSRRWLGSGVIRFQPSELAKLGLVFFAAQLFSRRSDTDEAPSPVPALIAFGVVALLVLAEPDMGTMLVMAVIIGAVIFVAGTPLKTLGGVALGGVGLTLIMGLMAPYRRDRLMSFMHPFNDHGNTGYQVVQSLVGVASGRITGVGLGASRAKWGFLPNAYTDFIFAIVAEELGLIGTVAIVGLFAALAVLGVRAAVRAPDRFGMLLAVGITAWITGQAVINVGAVIGLLPVTGVPLPFISFGGSALLFTMAAAGVLTNIASQGGAPARR